MAVALAVEFADGGVNGVVQGVGIGEGVMGEVVGLKQIRGRNARSARRLMARLAKAGQVRGQQDENGACSSPLFFHGLRHARGVEIALAGGSGAEIMAQLEHATDQQAKVYRRQANRRKLADAGQDRVDNVVKLKAAEVKPG